MIKRILLGIFATLSLGLAVAHEAQDDAVLEWNEIAIEALHGQPPPPAMLHAAMVQLAVFEAVNAITREFQSSMDGLNAESDASAPAAAVSAAHRVLSTLLPDRATELSAARDRSLARIPAGHAREAGITVGEAAAAAVLASRLNDGSDRPESYLPGSAQPGEWQLTAGCPPTGGVFLHWRNVKTFVIRSADQFRSSPPPALDSPQYTRVFNEVKEVGARDSTQRPPDRTTVARFYAVFGDAELWNTVARQLAAPRRQTLTQNARAFALLNVALHDLVVSLVETKYYYHLWRPETAIPAAESDGNDRTIADPSYAPLIQTPCHPSYPSGHAATSGVGREMLERLFGPRGHHIAVTSPDLPGVVLRYSTLQQIADDIDDARVFGGIHFRTDQMAGGLQGRQVATYVWQHAFRPARHCGTRAPDTQAGNHGVPRRGDSARACDARRREHDLQQERAREARALFGVDQAS